MLVFVIREKFHGKQKECPLSGRCVRWKPTITKPLQNLILCNTSYLIENRFKHKFNILSKKNQNNEWLSKSLIVILTCLLYTSDAADDMQCVDLGGRRIIKKIGSLVAAC